MLSSVATTKPRLLGQQGGLLARRRTGPQAMRRKLLVSLLGLAILTGRPGAWGDKKEGSKVSATAVTGRYDNKLRTTDAFAPARASSPTQAATGRQSQPASDTFPHVVTLPAGSKLRVRCLIPPQPKEVAQEFSHDLQFAVDADGTPWIGCDWRNLLNPAKRLHLKVPVSYECMVCTSNGALLLATKTDYGFLVPPAQPGKSEGVPQAVYQPIANLPVPGSRMVAGIGDCLYFIARRPGGGSDVFVHAPKQKGFGGFVRVFTSDADVTAVAGDGRTTFVAMGGLVVKVAAQNDAVTKVYSDYEQEITQLAWLPGTGLFYNTGQAIGFIGEKGANYLLASAPDEQIIALRDETLYVLHANALGVFAIENLSDLQRFDAPVREVPLADLDVEVRSVRLFRADEVLKKLPPVDALAFTDRFDRRADAKAFVYCLVDIGNRRPGEPGRAHLLSIVFYRADTNRVAWRHEETVRMEPQWPGLWVHPCVGQVRAIYPGEYIVKTYLDGALVNEQKFSVTGPVSLWSAVANDDLERTREALAAGEDVNAKDDDGRTPLMVAVTWASAKMVKILLDAGADPNARDEDGEPVLIKAVRSLDVDKVRYLLDAGADAKVRDKYGRSALHGLVSAADLGSQCLNPQGQTNVEKLVKLLVAHGANVNARDERGYTPLHRATLGKCPYLVEVLADSGADVNATDEKGLTPLDCVLVEASLAPSDPQDFLLLQRTGWVLQSKGAKLSHFLGKYFPGMERFLSPGNLLVVLAHSEDAAKNFTPDDPGLRRIGVAALLQQAQKQASAGDLRKAAYLAEEAARKAGQWGMKAEYAEALFDYALLRLAQGDADVAQVVLDQCIKADPKGAAARQARDLLKRLRGR